MKLKLEEQWAEVLAILFAVAGFILSVLLQHALLSYITIIIAGLVAGRVFYIKHITEPILPFVLIIAGFLLGYLAGGFWASRFWLVLFFLVALVVSYYLHKRRIFKVFQHERWVR